MAGVIRLFHKRGSNGERTVALSDLEHRVWFQYVMSADDYGVMRASASVLMADNRRLEREPIRRLEKAMAGVVASTLVLTFTHQGTVHWWQPDWQDFQQVQYPKDTILPAPPVEALDLATPLTRELFSVHDLSSQERKEVLAAFRKSRKKGNERFKDSFQESSEISLASRARASREIQTHTQIQTQTDPGSGSPEETPISTETSQPAWGHRRRGSPLVVNHPGCDVVTVAACARGFCVPKFCLPRWRQQLDPERLDVAGTDAHIRRVVAFGLDKLPPGGAIGGTKPEKFWGEVWEEFHAANAPKASGSRPTGGSRTGDSMAAAREYLAGRAAALASGEDR
jgi:hypothetical protein